jgi:Na+-translocating ferredoxin:NAD+ oxidoreductase RnfD subunit
MLASPQWWIYILVLVLTIFQKHLLTVDKNHFFNPSNFALIAAIALFYNETHIITGQLGEQLWLSALVVALAVAILVRVDRWAISLVFVLSYVVLQYFMVVGYDPVMTFEMIYERFYAVSFIVFVAFMLTDPRTTPGPKVQQIIFAIIIAAISTYLDRVNGFRVQHLFMALFVSSVWTPLLNAKVENRKKILILSSILFILAVGVIMFIENQPPYYFEMEG